MGLFLTLALVVAALVAGPSGVAPRGQPSVQAAWRARAAYSPSHEPRDVVLFSSRPNGDEVVQGFAGNCYFLSSLAGLARARPDQMRAAIRERVDGAYLVRLYRKERGTGRVRAVDVRVDRFLPRFRRGALLNGRSRDARELWVSIVEKAYAKLQRGYGAIHNGGYVTDALFALTGRSAEALRTVEVDGDALFTKLERTLASRGVVGAGTYSSAELRKAGIRDRLRAASARDLIPGLVRAERPTYTGTALRPGHAYTVWGVEREGDRRYVVVRDPYGVTAHDKGGPQANPKGGKLRMSLEAFMLLFEDVQLHDGAAIP